MDDSQTETIKLLKRHARKTDDAEIKTSVEETLKPDQIQILVELTFENQFEEFGTINAICFGIVAEQIGLSKEQANRLFEIGTEINEELADDIHQAKVDFLKDAFGSLDDEQIRFSQDERVIQFFNSFIIDPSICTSLGLSQSNAGAPALRLLPI
jgi:hypothetical protein